MPNDPNIEPSASDVEKWESLNARRLEGNAARAFNLLRGYGIEPILIKGWAAGRYYPADTPRRYNDIDLAVAETDHARALEVLRSSDGRTLGVDLHCGLRHLDTRPWNELFEGSRLVTLDKCELRILSDEDHFRVLAVHWLSDGGVRKDRLWDFYYFLDGRASGFDWQKCVGHATGPRKRWIETVVSLTHRYLGLETGEMMPNERLADVPTWMIRCLEKEWRDDVPLIPLAIAIRKRGQLGPQLRKRFPPNPIQATILMEGDFDERPRWPYQFRSLVSRLGPSIRRFAGRSKARYAI